MYNLITKLNPIALGIIGIILLILLINVVMSIVLKHKYKVLLNDIEDLENRENKLFEYALFNGIISDYSKAQQRNIQEINTLAIIERNMHKKLKGLFLSERFIKKSTSLMIILGLIGTFYGLTLAIGDLVQLLTSASEAIVGDVNAITDGLIAAVKSMSVAFLTSLFGIGASIIVTVLNTIYSVKDYREEVIISTEEYLDNYLSKTHREYSIGGNGPKSNLEFAFEKFASVIENNLEKVTNELTTHLTRSSKAMIKSAENIQQSVDKFDSSLDKFNEDVRDFSEFNHHLRTNIERMSVAFDDLTDDIKEQNDKLNINSLTQSINKLSEKVK